VYLVDAQTQLQVDVLQSLVDVETLYQEQREVVEAATYQALADAPSIGITSVLHPVCGQ